MEKRGIRTERGDLNSEIEVTNQKLRQLKARISKLKNWLKEEQENTDPPTLADYIQGILSRKVQTGKMVSCIERGSKRSRENQKKRLQYLAAGTAGTTDPKKTRYGAITNKAAG